MGRGLRSALGRAAGSDGDADAGQRSSLPRLDSGRGRVRCVLLDVLARRGRSLSHLSALAAARSIRRSFPPRLPTCWPSTASTTANEFFQLCARALDYCPPVDITFGDYLRALITASVDLKPEDDRGIRQALMQAISRARHLPGIRDASSRRMRSAGRACPSGPRDRSRMRCRPSSAEITDPTNGQREEAASSSSAIPSGLTKAQKDLNGEILRQYASENAARLGFDADPALPPDAQPYAPSFHQVFRVTPDGRLRIDMVVELVQTRRVPFDPPFPRRDRFRCAAA